jgi:hypothetical protein
MAEADLVLRLARPLAEAEWARVAGEMGGLDGVRAVAPVARRLHVRYDPARLAPSGICAAAGERGHPARVAAL